MLKIFGLENRRSEIVKDVMRSHLPHLVKMRKSSDLANDSPKQIRFPVHNIMSIKVHDFLPVVMDPVHIQSNPELQGQIRSGSETGFGDGFLA